MNALLSASAPRISTLTTCRSTSPTCGVTAIWGTGGGGTDASNEIATSTWSVGYTNARITQAATAQSVRPIRRAAATFVVNAPALLVEMLPRKRQRSPG